MKVDPLDLQADDGVHRFGDVDIRLAQRQVRRHGQVVPMGSRAFDLLETLLSNRHRVLDKDELLQAVWPNQVVEEANLAVQVHQIRRALGVQAITTVPGRGYRWTLAVAGPTGAAPSHVQSMSAEPQPAPAPDGTFPLPLRPRLFGRQAEVAQVLGWLELGAQVTLTGAAGVGKSALAVELAWQVRTRSATAGAGPDAAAAARSKNAPSPADVLFLELACLTDERRLLPALLGQLGLQVRAGSDPLQTLLHALRAKPMLVVLDNAEHLDEPVAAMIDALQQRAPHLVWLVTSQAPLHRRTEQVLPLQTLPLPPPGEHEPAALLRAPAVAFFVERASAADHRFSLNPENARDVAALCHQLEGWPLAIELAAARVHQLGLSALRALQTGQRWSVAQHDAARATGRHVSLQAALDWSHQHLPAPTQALWADLAVFAGSFTLEAACAVARPQLDDLPQTADVAPLHTHSVWVHEHLGQLVDRALLCTLPQADGRPRYRMLQTLRSYAAAQASSDAQAWQDAQGRQLRWYRGWLEQARAGHPGDAQQTRTWALDLEADSILPSITQALDDERHVPDALRICCALYHYWNDRALWSIAAGLLDRACRLADGAPPTPALRPWQARGWHDLSIMHGRQGQAGPARLAAERAVVLSQGIGSHSVEALALRARALCAMADERLADARADLDAARACAEQAGCDAPTRTLVLANCADLEREAGHDDAAAGLYQRVLQDHVARQEWRGVHAAHYYLALLALRAGDLASAQYHVAECHAAVGAADTAVGPASAAVGAGLLAVGMQQWVNGVRMLSAASARLQSCGWQSDRIDQQAIDEALAAARRALGADTFDDNFSAARAASWDEMSAQIQHWVRSADLLVVHRPNGPMSGARASTRESGS